MMKRHSHIVVIAGVAILLLASVASALDWPQWWGPDRDGISRETGLMASWPEGGPALLWEAPVGIGYSTVSVAEGRVFTLYQTDAGQWAAAFDEKTGEEIWKVPTGETYVFNSWDGPRSTPTVDGDRVYILDAQGNLLCLEVASGKKVWGMNVLETFSAKNLQWAFSMSPLIDGENLIVNVGESTGSSIVAFNKMDGSVVWKALDDMAGYSSPVVRTLSDKRQLVFFTQRGLLGILPEGGEALWRYPWKTKYDIHAATPIIQGNRVFLASGYKEGCALIEVDLEAEEPVKTVWRNMNMRAKFGNPILHKGYIYGFDEHFLSCVDWETGEKKWGEPGYHFGTLVIAGDMIYLLGEKGQLSLVRANPEKFELVSDAGKLLGKRCWSMPVVANGRLFVRDQEKLLCLDVQAK